MTRARLPEEVGGPPRISDPTWTDFAALFWCAVIGIVGFGFGVRDFAVGLMIPYLAACMARIFRAWRSR